MARYKYIDTSPRFLPVDLAAQLLPGTFEHAARHLLSGVVDLSRLDARLRNDEMGAPAYPPAMLLTVVLCADAYGAVSSRGVARLCREHVTFIALCGDTAPHFTTVAQFVSTVSAAIAPVFAAVLAVCDAQGLIGREMFAIDGVELPGNASKHRSGRRADFERQAAKLEPAAAAMLARHRAEDARPVEPDVAAEDEAGRARLERDAAELRAWPAAHPDDRRGPTGGVRKGNRTDADSAKMATVKGVIQGYTGVAAVDSVHQVVVEAQAHGTGAEQEVLVPVVTTLRPVLAPRPTSPPTRATTARRTCATWPSTTPMRASPTTTCAAATSASRPRSGTRRRRIRCTTKPRPRRRRPPTSRATSRTTPTRARACAWPGRRSTARAAAS